VAFFLFSPLLVHFILSFSSLLPFFFFCFGFINPWDRLESLPAVVFLYEKVIYWLFFLCSVYTLFLLYASANLCSLGFKLSSDNIPESRATLAPFLSRPNLVSSYFCTGFYVFCVFFFVFFGSPTFAPGLPPPPLPQTA